MAGKKITVLSAAILAAVIGCSASFTADAAEANYSQTRFRFPIVKFELPVFVSGKTIDDPHTGTKRVYSEPANKNGEDKLFFASVEQYPFLGKTNRALRVQSRNSNHVITESYQAFVFKPNAKIGSSVNPFQNKPAIPAATDDSGLMFYYASTGLGEDPVYHFYQGGLNPYIVDYQSKGVNVTWQEGDYYSDGSPRMTVDDGDTYQAETAFNAGNGEVTLIWTKDFQHTFMDETPHLTADYKAGDVQVVRAKSGSIELPRGFCGYVLIPFSSMEPTWDTENPGGMIDLRKIQTVNLHMGLYPQNKGNIWIDDLCFYGPAFEGLEGTVDIGEDYDVSDLLSGKEKGELVSQGADASITASDGNAYHANAYGSTVSSGSVATGDHDYLLPMWGVLSALTATFAVIALRRKRQ